ncbi:MAG TPA: hypothetical protein VFE53_06145 [Mucilaginibacter sp.]|nr:hypothetical protein [Mucilaginibacter sp.]
MFADYQAEVLQSYQEKKGANQLSLNLIHSTAAKLRNECEVVAVKRYLKKDENTIRSFFGQQNDLTGYVTAIKKFDPEKFKPLDSFLKGNIKNTDQKNIELLAWLIDFEPRPYRVDRDLFNVTDHGISLASNEKNKGISEVVGESEESAQVGNVQRVLAKEAPRRGTRKSMILVGLVALIIAAVYLFWGHGGPEGCMLWAGDRYKQVSCNQKPGDAMVIALDTSKLYHFKKITRQDTITVRSLGRIWYSKINNNVEFFTADGYHPVHVERHLKPLTLYMINKYIVHK